MREDKDRRGGGPKSPEGKVESSKNSTTHGMRSKNVLILPDETLEEYEETRAGWLTEFEPEGYREVRLVDLLIRNDWFLKRANRRLLEAEAAIVASDNTNPAN